MVSGNRPDRPISKNPSHSARNTLPEDVGKFTTVSQTTEGAIRVNPNDRTDGGKLHTASGYGKKCGGTRRPSEKVDYYPSLGLRFRCPRPPPHVRRRYGRFAGRCHAPRGVAGGSRRGAAEGLHSVRGVALNQKPLPSHHTPPQCHRHCHWGCEETRRRPASRRGGHTSMRFAHYPTRPYVQLSMPG